MQFRRYVFAAVVVSSLAAPSVASAEASHPTFVAEISGADEVPATTTPAAGFAGVQFSMDGHTVYYSITLTDASTQLTAAHLHFAPHGEAGPVVVTLCSAQTTPCKSEGQVAQGTFTAADLSGPFANAGLERLLDETRNGMVYANVHSTRFADGEARGQLVELGAMMMHTTEPAMDHNMDNQMDHGMDNPMDHDMDMGH